MDVAEWLRKLGLDEYEAAFRANDVDGEVLPRLTADDLISIGVNSVGHRRRLLDAIAALGVEMPTTAATAPRGQPDAERRQLTVMFCATWSARPPCRRGSILRICAKSSPPITVPSAES